MKKLNLFGLALVTTVASLTACTNDAEEVLSNESEIKLTSEITPSRVTSLDYQSTQIVKGQQIGVTITGAKAEHKNVAWTAGEDGDLNNTGTPIYWSNGEATIYAYHPYNANWTGENHTFTVATDQSTDNGYLNSDLLWAKNTGTKSQETVELTFTHKLAKINVALSSDDITDLSGATISICGTNIATNINLLTGELAATSSNVQDINVGTTTSSTKAASAIIIPQTVTSGTQFIRVKHSNKTFFYTLTADKPFEAGKAYNYNLKVKESLVELTLMSNSVTDWKNEEVIESEIIEISTPTINNITANTATLTAFAVGGTKGIEISTSPQFTNCITAGETTSSNITAEFISLEENTKYYARTYTIDAANGKSYSEAIMFVPTSVYPKPYIIFSNEYKAEIITNGIPLISQGIFLVNLCNGEGPGTQENVITNGKRVTHNINDNIMNFSVERIHNIYFCWFAENEHGITYSNGFFTGGGCECNDGPVFPEPLD